MPIKIVHLNNHGELYGNIDLLKVYMMIAIHGSTGNEPSQVEIIILEAKRAPDTLRFL